MTTENTVESNLPEKKVKPSEQIAKLEMNNAILEQALYQAYDDYDEMFAVLRYVIEDVEKPEFSKYQVRNALKSLRTLMIANQSMMMDCAGLEY